MKKRKLKGFVLPSLYLLCFCVLAVGITLLSKKLLEEQHPIQDEHYNYTMSVFDEEEEEPVNNEQTKVSKPFMDENVAVEKDFYKEEDTSENQEKALIYYQNTYMQNTGILYASDNVFDIVAVMDGTIKEIKQDEILGTVLTLESENNVSAVYYTLGEVKVTEGSKVKQNDIIATSGQSQIETTKQTLLFEVYINGILTNPNIFYEKNLTDFN